MVVGIERAGQRMISPESDLRLSAEDVLWIVGEKECLMRLVHELGQKELHS